jgi:hypothetical protein
VARLPGIAQAPRCEGHPVLAYNVFRLPTAREPTEGRRRAVQRLSREADIPARVASGAKRRAAVSGCYLPLNLPVARVRCQVLRGAMHLATDGRRAACVCAR